MKERCKPLPNAKIVAQLIMGKTVKWGGKQVGGKPMSVAAIARALGTTAYKMKVALALAQPEVQRTQPKPKFTPAEQAIVVSEVKLQEQAGLSLKDRAAQFSEFFGKKVKYEWIQQLYKGQGITRQVCRKMKGPPVHRNVAFQQQKLDLLRIDLERLFRNNIGTVVQVDEVVFSPNELR